MPKLFSSNHVIKILLKKGFFAVSQRGSHKKFKKNNLTVIIPVNKREIPWGTLKSILRQSNLKEEDLS